MEVHPQPEKALCDGPNAMPLGQVESLLQTLLKIHAVVSEANSGK